MPLPAILAALARVGASVAARAGASTAARSLLTMSRAAGPSVARRAATKAAARAAGSRGAAAATTQAAEAAEGIHIRPGNAAPPGLGRPIGGGGPRVLENTTLTNARALFQAIHGQTPPAGATVEAAAAAAPGSQVQAAAATAQQAAAAGGAPPVTPPATPPIPPPSSAPPPSPGSTPPSNPRPQGLLDRALDAWQRARSAYESARNRYTPIADQVAGMTMDQRYGRLQQSGKLSNIGDVAKHFGTPSPSRDQHVQHSEEEEERQRQESIAQSRKGQVGQAVWSAGKRSLAAAISQATPAGIATQPLWLYGVIRGFEQLGRAISETNRDLRKFDERISDSFARLDYAQLRSRQQVARATSGSATFLNDQLANIVRELQPMRETFTTFMNGAGASLVYLARAAAVIVKWHPLFVAMHKTAQLAERMMGKGKADEAQKATKDFMRSIRDGSFRMPKVPRPGDK